MGSHVACRQGKHSFERFNLAILAAILALAFFTGAAFAHEVEPVTASPAAGEVLAASPSEVRLTFSEELAEQGSTLQVFDSTGKQVDSGSGGVDLNDPDHAALVVALPALPEGVYRVVWQVTLLDGDASRGEYSFGIGNVTVPASAGEQTTAAGTSTVLAVPSEAAPVKTAQAGAAQGASNTAAPGGGSGSIWVLIIAAAGIVAAGIAAVAAFLAARRSRPGG